MRKNTKKQPHEMTQLENLKNDPFGYLVMGYYSPKHLKRQEEYAKDSQLWQNNFTRSMYKCSATAQKIFCCIMAEFQKQKRNAKENCVNLELSDMIFGLNISDGKKTRTTVNNAIEELRKLGIVLQDDEHAYHVLNIFEEIKYDFDWGTCKFWLTQKTCYFLENLSKMGFTLIQLDKVGKLQSFYAIRYFQIAMSFYGFKGQVKNRPHTWFFSYSLEQLKALFRIEKDEYTRTSNLVNRVVNEPIAEINEKLPQYHFEVEKVYKGKKLDGFVFWVTEKNQKLKIAKTDNPDIQEDKRIINAEREEVEKFKTQFPNEFAEAMQTVKAQNKLPFPIETFDEFEAVKLLKNNGYAV